MEKKSGLPDSENQKLKLRNLITNKPHSPGLAFSSLSFLLFPF
jgi:hypothetical protein